MRLNEDPTSGLGESAYSSWMRQEFCDGRSAAARLSAASTVLDGQLSVEGGEHQRWVVSELGDSWSATDWSMRAATAKRMKAAPEVFVGLVLSDSEDHDLIVVDAAGPFFTEDSSDFLGCGLMVKVPVDLVIIAALF